MKRHTVNFIHNNLYSVGGLVIISGIYMLTGVFVVTVLSYAASVGLLELLPRVLH